MFEPSEKAGLWTRFVRAFWSFDAWVNSSMYESRQSARRSYDRFVVFMEQFHMAGWRRLGVDRCSGA